MNETPYRSWVEIDRAALVHNLGVLRARLPAGTALMGVVKANAYGHGLALVAEAIAGSVEWYGVANLDEALELRAAVEPKPTLLLGPALPSERAPLLAAGFVPSVSDLEEAQSFSEHATRLGIV